MSQAAATSASDMFQGMPETSARSSFHLKKAIRIVKISPRLNDAEMRGDGQRATASSHLNRTVQRTPDLQRHLEKNDCLGFEPNDDLRMRHAQARRRIGSSIMSLRVPRYRAAIAPSITR